MKMETFRLEPKDPMLDIKELCRDSKNYGKEKVFRCGVVIWLYLLHWFETNRITNSRASMYGVDCFLDKNIAVDEWRLEDKEKHR